MKQLLLFLLMVLMSVATQAQVWTTGTPIPEPMRASNAASYIKDGNGFLFMVSGRNSAGLITPVHQRYDLSNNSWTTLADYPTGILGATAVTVKDSLYVIGGLVTTPGNASRKVFKYSINSNTWTQKANYPTAIVDAKAVSYQDSLIYVIGGYQHLVRVYNTHTNKWRSATLILPPGGSLSWGGIAVKNDTLVYMCGTDNFLSSNYFNTVRIGVIDQNNRANITWSEGTPFPGQTRTFFDAEPWKDGIIMTGGSTDNTFETNSNECYHYNVGTDTWTQLPSKPTAWLTGNSGSLFIDGEWKLICASGFGSDYLSQTEIFTETTLSTVQPRSKCNLQDFQFLQDSTVHIRFCLEKEGTVDVNIRDMNGKLVKTLTNVASKSGSHDIRINTISFPKGIYLCTLKQGKSVVTKKIVIDQK